jgi:dephospho-CoA kinase
VAGIVFGSLAARRRVERVLHPLVERAIRRRIRASRRRVVVLDVPLLIEAGMREYCHRLVFVEAPRRERRARTAARGWTAREFAARERAQLSLAAKRAASDAIIDNGKGLAHTRAQVLGIWHDIVPAPAGAKARRRLHGKSTNDEAQAKRGRRRAGDRP